MPSKNSPKTVNELVCVSKTDSFAVRAECSMLKTDLPQEIGEKWVVERKLKYLQMEFRAIAARFHTQKICQQQRCFFSHLRSRREKKAAHRQRDRE